MSIKNLPTERFSKAMWRALRAAEQDARDRNRDYVAVDSLLIGILADAGKSVQESNFACLALMLIGEDLKELLQKICELNAPSPVRYVLPDSLSLTPRAERLLIAAAQTASTRNILTSDVLATWFDPDHKNSSIMGHIPIEKIRTAVLGVQKRDGILEERDPNDRDKTSALREELQLRILDIACALNNGFAVERTQEIARSFLSACKVGAMMDDAEVARWAEMISIGRLIGESSNENR